MPRAGWIKPDVDHRLSDHLAFAMLTRVFPPDVVDEVIAESGRVQHRTRMLPSRIVVYYVLGLALFSHSSYDEVIRLLIAGQSWSSGWSESWPVPTKAALYKARQRLGPEPLRMLFERTAKPIADEGGETGFYRGRRLLGMDGLTLDIPNTAANEAEFAYPETPRAGAGEVRRPSVRLFGLTELGTGAIVHASIGGNRDENSTAVTELLPALGSQQLVLGASELFSPELWAGAAARGADLLWELPAGATLPVESRNVDGSYSSRIAVKADSDSARWMRNDGRAVRVLEHSTDGDRGAGEPRRFATTMHDPTAAPTDELVALFSRRRSLATAFDEFRAHRNSPRVVLRSKIPAGVRQEIYGYLCVHYAMRWIMNAPDAHAPGRTPARTPAHDDLMELARPSKLSPDVDLK